MDKILNFLKKNYVFTIIAVAILLVIIIVSVVMIKKGTFGQEEAKNRLVITCDRNYIVSTPENQGSIGDALEYDGYKCGIKLYYDTNTYNETKKILSVNANFSLPTGVTFNEFSFLSDAYDVAEFTENGFAVGDTDGLENETTIGMLVVDIDESITNGTFTIGLNNIELSDSEYVMIPLENATTTIVVGDGGDTPGGDTPTPSGDVTFDNTVSVAESDEVIYNVPLGTTYSSLLSKITTTGTITIYDDLGNTIAESNYGNANVGTGCRIVIRMDANTTHEYHFATSNDYNGDGLLDMSDISKLFYLWKSGNSEVIYRYAGDLDHDGDVPIYAVSALLNAWRTNSQ